MNVSLLVPFRAERGTIRDRVWNWTRARWAHHYPDWEIVQHHGDQLEPFSKTTAINEAFKVASGDVLVVCDADSWMDADLTRAVEHAAAEKVLVVPWNKSWRVREEESARLLHEDPATAQLGKLTEVADKGPHAITAAMCFVISREAFVEVNGMDRRFRGYRFEDVSFRRACDYTLGRGRYLYDSVYCLWHPRDTRETVRGTARVWGEQDSGDLNRWLNTEYIRARSTPSMRTLIQQHEL